MISAPISLSESAVFRDDSPLKYGCMAVVTLCGLCLIFPNPILRLKEKQQNAIKEGARAAAPAVTITATKPRSYKAKTKRTACG